MKLFTIFTKAGGALRANHEAEHHFGSVEKLANRVDATPSSRFCWNKKAAGRRFYFALPSFSTEAHHL